MKDTDSCKIRDLLEACLTAQRVEGIDAKLIREGKSQRPDILLRDSLASYLIEVKRREAPEGFNKLQSGKVQSKCLDWSNDNTIQEKIRKAHRQTSSYVGQQSHEDYYCLAWLRMMDHSVSEIRDTQAQSELLGIADVVVQEENGRVRTPCVYARRPLLRKVPGLCAVVLETPEGCCMFANAFCPQSERFACTELAKLFQRGEAFYDHAKLKNGGYLFAEIEWLDEEFSHDELLRRISVKNDVDATNIVELKHHVSLIKIF